MSGLILRLPGLFTDKTIPKMYRDKVITAGTKFCFDARDVFSYVKQAAPIAGIDVWKNLLEGGLDATFTGSVGFDNGFKLVNGGGEYITLPTSGVVPENAEAVVVILWVKRGTPAATGGAAVINCGSAYTPAANQYAMTWFNKELRFHVGGWQSTALAPDTGSATDTYQFAMSMKKRPVDGKYDLAVYINGAPLRTNISSFTSVPQPAAGAYAIPYFGNAPSYAAVGWEGNVLRALYDDCSVKSAVDLVALDYAENRARMVV